MYYKSVKLIALLLLCVFFNPCLAKKQNLNGEILSYYKGSVLKEKASYKNGILHGTRYKYFKDGKTIKQITHFTNGKKTGLEKRYDKRGILRDFKQY